MPMTYRNPLERQTILVDSLMRSLGSGGAAPQLFETHISWVVVAGAFAYKLKKALRFDFLDFSTIEKRAYFCKEELRLNRRLAPELYLGVAAITGNPRSPEIDGAGAVIEYAVKMRAFPQEALWSHRIARQGIGAAEIDELADKLGAFHDAAARASVHSPWGRPDIIGKATGDSMEVIRSLVSSEEERQVQALAAWEHGRQAALREAFEKRRHRGFVRECHGDLHCGNILSFEGRVEAFDCIEFNDSLRWIDVFSDLAFIVMDLRFHGLSTLAARLLNRYLETTGDYEDLAVLRYYVTYRALVRCKVALLKARQLPSAGQERCASDAQANAYLAFAARSIATPAPAIMITHGFSGCGKSTLAATLVEVLGAVRIRSDVERKRLRGLDPLADASAMAEAVYGDEATRSTYERLRMLAERIAGAGFSVIVDAAFLSAEERRRFARLANELGLPFRIFDVRASEETMRKRLALRKRLQNDPSDADAAVLERQLASHEALAAEEMPFVTVVDGAICADPEEIRRLALT